MRNEGNRNITGKTFDYLSSSDTLTKKIIDNLNKKSVGSWREEKKSWREEKLAVQRCKHVRDKDLGTI